MQVEFDGRTWEMDPSKLRVQQGIVIQGYTGMSVGDWQDSLDFNLKRDGDGKVVLGDDGNPVILNQPASWLKSVIALHWLMLQQNDIKVPIADDDFELEAFLAAYINAQLAELARVKAELEAKKAAESRPTSPPPTLLAVPSPAYANPTITTPPPPVPQEVVPVIASG